MAEGITVPAPEASLTYKIETTNTESGWPMPCLGEVAGVAAMGDSGTATNAVAYTIAVTEGIYEIRYFDATTKASATPDNVYMKVSTTASDAATADNDNLFPSSVVRLYTFRVREGQISLSWFSAGNDILVVWKKKV